MQNNRKRSDGMENQTTIKKEENILERAYINWTHKRKGTYLEEPVIIIFKQPERIKPFNKQIPEKVLTKEQLKEQYGVEI